MTPGAEPSPRRLRWLSGALLAATFAAGLITGVGAAVTWGSPPPHRGGPEAFPSKELGLSAEQEAQVRDVFARHQPRMDALVQEVVPRMRALSGDIEAELLQVLTEEQRRRFERFKAGRPAPIPVAPRGP
ncbi:MAG TPA: periplasmic heavy metal sensor [Myxococcus sp.]|nr:periplasmic heavy metal sensor [Myxococcus sp.]